MAKKYNHIHKYERKMLGKLTIFKCTIPNCTHYVRKELAENLFSICWRCDEGFVLSKVALELKRPHCSDCTKRKKKIKIDRLKQLLNAHDLLKEAQ